MVSLFIASFVIFAALYLAPGNPVAALSAGRPLPPGSIRVLDQRYHLNEPFLAQYSAPVRRVFARLTSASPLVLATFGDRVAGGGRR